MEIKDLLEIAEFLGNKQAVHELHALQQRVHSENASLTLPLVGEFSAGKTSLLNSITESKKLEVATKPTTATIYELHFGSEREYATILKPDGSEEEVNDITSLRNEDLGDMPLVRIYDSSKRVPRDLILIDTPGLSSPDPKHKDVLVNFLPQADALLMVIDCNQQITRTLQDFIEQENSAGRKVYLVITKCDTKPEQELQTIKEYIAKNSKLPVDHLICVSAATGYLDEFYGLIQKLTQEKKLIRQTAIEAHKKRISEILRLCIEELLKLPRDSKGLDDSLEEAKSKKRNSEKEVDKLIDAVQQAVDNNEDYAKAKFQMDLFARIDNLLASRGDAMTMQANSILKAVTAKQMVEYRSSITRALDEEGRRSSPQVQAAIASLDLDNLEISSHNIDLDLSSIGHEYDKAITYGIGALAVAATVATAVAVAAPAVAAAAGIATAGTAATTAAQGALTVSTAMSAVDTMTDVGSVAYSMRMAKKMERIKTVMEAGGTVIQQGQQLVEQGQQLMSSVAPAKQEGFFTGLVGMVTEGLYAKPQRRRVVNEYLESQVIPHFISELRVAGYSIMTMLQSALKMELATIYAELEQQIDELRQSISISKSEYDKRMSILKKYNEVLTSK